MFWHNDSMVAQRKHAPMDWSCDKHQMQGIWGAARPGYPLGGGEREGQSPLASMQLCGSSGAMCSAGSHSDQSVASPSGEREGQSPLASMLKAQSISSGEREGRGLLAFMQ